LYILHYPEDEALDQNHDFILIAKQEKNLDIIFLVCYTWRIRDSPVQVKLRFTMYMKQVIISCLFTCFIICHKEGGKLKVSDIMAKNVISVSPDETISHAIAKMRKSNVHQLPVVNGGKLYGLLELRRIATKDVDPKTTKVYGLAVNVPTINADTDIIDAASLLLNVGLRALPVKDGNSVVGVVSETDIMKVAKQFVKGLNMKVREIITPAEYVEKGSRAGGVKRIMRDRNVSRVPIVDKGKIIGIIGTMDLIRLIEGKQRMPTRGGRLQEMGAKEKLTIEETPVETIMRAPVIVSGDTSISNAIDLLKENEEAVVSNGIIGIITPKDIMELFASAPKKQLYVQITGMQKESIEFQVTMDKAVDEFVKKMGKMINNIEYFFIHVDKIEKGGRVDLYSIRVRFKVPFGFFVAHASGWKPLNVIQDVMRKLEREVLKKYGKMEDMRKRRRQRNRYA